MFLMLGGKYLFQRSQILGKSEKPEQTMRKTKKGVVTNNDYEEEINNNKRQIFLLDKIFLKDIVAQYKKLVR